MKLSAFKGDYQWFAEKASDTARALALAGFAVIWVFRTGDGAQSRVPPQLLAPAILLGLALGCDLFQYLVAALVWRAFFRHHEDQTAPGTDPDIRAPKALRWPGNFFFFAKEL